MVATQNRRRALRKVEGIDDLAMRLVESRLVVAPQSQSLLANFRAETASTSASDDPNDSATIEKDDRDEPNARRFAEWLVRRKVLTKWQAKQILAGRTVVKLGPYEILEPLGQGAMGVVYKVREEDTSKIYALKVLSPALVENEQAVARFQREAKTAAALQHPNLVRTFEADDARNKHFLVMEILHGSDLRQWMDTNGTIEIPIACEIARQAALGLGHAHVKDIVHRDIKPSNLFVTWASARGPVLVKIMDMGLARFLNDNQHITKTGQLMGTADYVAPELVQNPKALDGRSDVFSLGCTLFELITGQIPFPGPNRVMRVLSRCQKDAPRLSSLVRDVPESLDRALAKMLCRDPKNRYEKADEVAAALTPFTMSGFSNGRNIAEAMGNLFDCFRPEEDY